MRLLFCIIGILTSCMQFQDFTLNSPTPCTITVGRRSPHRSSRKWNTSTKVPSLRINLNINVPPVSSRSHTYPSHSQTFLFFTSSLSSGHNFPVPSQPIQCMCRRCVDPSVLSFSHSLHRHSFIRILVRSHFSSS